MRTVCHTGAGGKGEVATRVTCHGLSGHGGGFGGGPWVSHGWVWGGARWGGAGTPPTSSWGPRTGHSCVHTHKLTKAWVPANPLAGSSSLYRGLVRCQGPL
jgi:hypothetical protein